MNYDSANPGKEDIVPELGVSSSGWVVRPGLDADRLDIGTCEKEYKVGVMIISRV